MDFNGDPGINGITGAVPFVPFNKETIFYSEMNTTWFVNDPYYAKADTVLYASYDDNDLRKIAYFKPNNGYYQFKGNYTALNTGTLPALLPMKCI